MIRSFGDSVNLRILSFFIENPFDHYSINQLAEFSEVSRNSVYKYLPAFLEKEYLIKEIKGKREVYRLNRSNRIILLLDRFIDQVGDEELRPMMEERASSRTGAAQRICQTAKPVQIAVGSA